jgi:hypothetical protein
MIIHFDEWYHLKLVLIFKFILMVGWSFIWWMDPFEDGSRFLNAFIVGWSFIWGNELSEDGNYFEILYGWMMIDLVDEPTHLKIVITCSRFILEGSHSIHQTSFQWWLFIQWGMHLCIQIHFIWCRASFFHPSKSHLIHVHSDDLAKLSDFEEYQRNPQQSPCLHLVFEPPLNPWLLF